MRLITLVLLFSTIGICVSEKTKLIISFTPNLFNKAGNFLLPLLLENLPMNVDYAPYIPENDSATFHELTLKSLSLDLPPSLMSFDVSNNKVTLTTGKLKANAEIKLTQYESLGICKDIGGNTDITANSVVIELKLTREASSGRPALEITSVKLNSFKLDISSGSWLDCGKIISWISGLLAGTIGDEIKNGVNKTLKETLGNATMTPYIFADVALDLRMHDAPAITKVGSTNVMALNFAGSFVLNSTLPEIDNGGDPSGDVIAVTRTTHMISFNFGTMLSNSLMYTIRESGLLEYSVTAYDLPDSTRQYLNTQFYRFLIRPLFNKYPKRYLSLKISTPHPPKFVLVADKGMRLDTSIEISFDVFAADKTLIPTITVILNAKAEIRAYVEADKEEPTKSRLFLKVLDPTFDITLTNHNEIDDFNLDFLSATFDSLLTTGASAFNALLRNGILIPEILGLKIGNPAVLFSNTDAFVGLDILFPAKADEEYVFWNDLFEGFLISLKDPPTTRRSAESNSADEATSPADTEPQAAKPEEPAKSVEEAAEQFLSAKIAEPIAKEIQRAFGHARDAMGKRLSSLITLYNNKQDKNGKTCH